MNQAIQYIESNRERFLEELKEFLRFPSVSTKPSHNQHIRDCAEWLKNNIIQSGLDNVRIIDTIGHPLVYAEWLGAGENAPTVLIYGHYDVQPEDPIELWNTPPFEPTVKDGKIWGRGTADDKGQVFMHVKACEALIKTGGKLPVNVKFLIEGEEESGGEAIMDFLPKNRELLKCDTVMISDTSWFAPGLPTITYALRGIAVVHISLTGPNRDLHSGSYGGAVHNPLNALCEIIAKMHDENGKVAIPGFYDDVLELSQEERDSFKKLPFDLEEYKKEMGIAEVKGEEGYSTLERQWARPTFDLNGIWGGYIEDGHKSIIPSKASAKISMRIVANQSWEDVSAKLEKYLREITPVTMKLEIEVHHGGSPAFAPLDSKGIRAAQNALKAAFGTESVFMREGGSIPIVSQFQEELKAPAVLMGFGLDSDNIHSPNENYDLGNFFGGIKACAYFLDEMGK